MERVVGECSITLIHEDGHGFRILVGHGPIQPAIVIQGGGGLVSETGV